MDLLENNLFFNKTRLIENIQLEINSTVDEFRDKFKQNVIDFQESYGVSRPKSEFQGKIKRDTFRIARTFSAFEVDLVSASGEYSEIGERSKINLFVYLPIGTFILIYSMMLTIDMLSIYFFTTSGPIKSLSAILLFGAVLTSFTTLWPYVFMRRSIRKLKNDLEKEFYYWYR
jgi:hypothetical protein